MVHRPPTRPRTQLPVWPLVACFASFPLGWVLGIGFALPVLWSGVMLGLLVLHHPVRFPRILLVWLVFLGVVAVSALMLEDFPRFIGFLFRFGNYASAIVAFVYAYNLAEQRASDRRIAGILVFFWSWVVVGGFLGIVFPFDGFTTPAASILPGFLVENELVQEWVMPRFAEVQHPWGAPAPFARPSAPFPYTNTWGCNYALLLPLALRYLVSLRGWRRAAFAVFAAASVLPAVTTLNRGMFLAIGIGIGYVIVRMALAGQVVPLAAGVLTAATLSVGLVFSGVADRILLRTTYSATNETRGRIYREAFERTLESPVIGWGAPRPSLTMDLSVGTQGHVWNVMFSHGFVALALFLGGVWWLAWRSRRAPGFGAAAHVTLVMASAMVVYYGFDGPQLLIAMVAAGFALRGVDQPERALDSPVPEPRARGVLAVSRVG